MRDIAREHALELVLVAREQIVQPDALSLIGDLGVVRDVTDQPTARNRGILDLDEEGRVGITEQIGERKVVGELESETVAEARFHDRLGNTPHPGGVAGGTPTLAEQTRDGFGGLDPRRRVGQPVLVDVGGKEQDAVARALQFGRDDPPGLGGGDGERDQRRGNVQPLEGAGHRVLAADRADAECHLRLKRAEQRRKRLTPPGSVASGMLEILLEGEINVLEIGARRDQPGDRLEDREIRAVIRALLGEIGVEAERHQRDVVGMSLLHRDLLHHRLYRGELALTAERHQHRAGADGRVETLG